MKGNTFQGGNKHDIAFDDGKASWHEAREQAGGETELTKNKIG